MTKFKRITALFVVFAFAFVLLASAAFIAHNADHDCVGEDCIICAQISFCNSVVRSLSLVVVAVYISAIIFKITRREQKSVKQLLFDSPVNNKTRLLN